MTSKLTYAEIREAALQLKEEERGMLVEELELSFDDSPELKAELDRRYEEMVTGKVATFSLEEVMQETHRAVEQVRANRKSTS